MAVFWHIAEFLLRLDCDSITLSLLVFGAAFEKASNFALAAICAFAVVLAIAFLVVILVFALRVKDHPLDITECYEEADGSDYRGVVNMTRSGEDCAEWTDQTHHQHSRTPDNYPNAGLGDHNYCRNPDGDVLVWCYTNNLNRRWDYCDIGDPREDCSVTTVAPTSPQVPPGITECYEEMDGSDYRGVVNMTQRGVDCSEWTDQTHHQHSRTPDNYPNAGLGDHNYCRNPDGDVHVWCYTTNLTIRWDYCDIGDPREDCITECYEETDGSDYRGIVNMTQRGVDCSEWTDQTYHYHSRTPDNYPNAGLGDHNYCRNPDGDVHVWCYTTNLTIRWDYCDIGDPRDDCNECYKVPDASDYRGKKSTTIQGETCQQWTEQTPHKHTRTPENFPGAGLGDHNYCRNPDADIQTWCYTTNPAKRWGLCDVGDPYENCGPTSECYRDVHGTDYRGTLSVAGSGDTCQKWTWQTPHSHTRTPQNYPNAGLGNHNHCRNPDDKVAPWCYTVNPSVRWRYCRVGRPGANCVTTTEASIPTVHGLTSLEPTSSKITPMLYTNPPQGELDNGLHNICIWKQKLNI
ncbi:apolipoprotein(a)-like [Saccoglossus kowalevskii]